MKLEVDLTKRGVLTIIGAVLILAGIFGVIAYGTTEPSKFGHTASEIDGLEGLVGGGESVLLDEPVVLSSCENYVGYSSVQIIEAGVTSGLPVDAKEVLLFVRYDRGGTSGNNAGRLLFKQPAQINWKDLVFATDTFYTNENSAWIPLDSEGKLEWKQGYNKITGCSKHSFEIQGYKTSTGTGSSGSGGGLEYTGSTEMFHAGGDVTTCSDPESTIMLMEYFGGKPENGNQGCFVDNQGTTSVQGRVEGEGPACRWACFK